MKRIVAYGDSWTGGEGCNRVIEDTLSMHEKILYQKENSWVKFLSDKLCVNFENKGVSGYSNNKIFNLLVDDVKNGATTKNDLVIIMWSSALRDYLPFLPNLNKGEWLSWSINHLIETPERFITSTKTDNRYYDFFIENYKKFYLENLYSQLYYSIINQNYILFIQNYLTHYNINYVMCDGIENMFLGTDPVYDKTNLINSKSYWQFKKNTIRGWLTENSDENFWEYREKWNTRSTQHPNINGHKKISNELCRFIKELNF